MKRERRFQRVAIFFFFFVLGSWTLVLRAGAESDQAPEKPWERFSLILGGGVAFLKSDVRVGSESTGVSVNVEDQGDASNLKGSIDLGFSDLRLYGKGMY